MAIDSTQGDMAKQYGQLVARAWSEPAFKQRLLTDPKAVFAEHGLQVESGIELKVVEDTPTLSHFVLPPPPSEDLSDEKLDLVAGGALGDIASNCASSSRGITKALTQT